VTCYDVFNGDADGICALQQLRLHNPRQAQRITGLKREIDLLGRIDAKSGDEITVLDVSLEKNHDALMRALDQGAKVFYADHHFPGEIPRHERLDAHIDVAATTCTSLIINQYLENAQARWAVVGAFGDNFDAEARTLGESIGLNRDELTKLQQLGICLNYNGYGFELQDLMFDPAVLFERVHPYQDPIDFIERESGYAALLAQYQDDMKLSVELQPDSKTETSAVYLLPNQSWARRIVGVMGNDLAKQFPGRAHALLVDMGDGHYRVSVRAPYRTKQGADDLCRRFAGGGGRKAAAGINRLPRAQLPHFVELFNRQFREQK